MTGVDTMVITASVRTDIPAFYSEWFIKQIHQGYVHVPNPFYPGKIKHISLRKENVDAIIFWTKNRSHTYQKWSDAIVDHSQYHLLDVAEVKEFRTPKALQFYHYTRALLLFFISIAATIIPRNFNSSSPKASIVIMVYSLIVASVIYLTYTIVKYSSPIRHLKGLANALYYTLLETGKLESRNAEVRLTQDEYKVFTYIILNHATTREQHLFTQAMKELLSAIDNPRYLIVKKSWLIKYRVSYPVPSIFGNEETIQILKTYLEKYSDHYDVIYTRCEKGRRILLKSKQKSFLNKNEKEILKRKVYEKKKEIHKARKKQKRQNDVQNLIGA